MAEIILVANGREVDADPRIASKLLRSGVAVLKSKKEEEKVVYIYNRWGRIVPVYESLADNMVSRHIAMKTTKKKYLEQEMKRVKEEKKKVEKIEEELEKEKMMMEESSK